MNQKAGGKCLEPMRCIGEKKNLELAIEANRGAALLTGQDNRAMLSIRLAKEPLLAIADSAPYRANANGKSQAIFWTSTQVLKFPLRHKNGGLDVSPLS